MIDSSGNETASRIIGPSSNRADARSDRQSVGLGRRRFLGLSAGVAGAVAAGVGLAACSSVSESASGTDGASATAADGDATDATDDDLTTATATAAAPTAADIGFLTDMSAHHGQALVMCQRVLGQDIGTPAKAAAAEVLQNQAIELGIMRAWLSDWGESTAPPELVMAWMGHGDGMPLAMMPGLATAAELAELSQAVGMAQGRRWLELMLVHHEGGVAMAEAAVEMAAADKVVRLAQNQAAVQTYEISQYEQLLATTYAA
jgi:uncharacterized protein (DUF305 family)